MAWGLLFIDIQSLLHLQMYYYLHLYMPARSTLPDIGGLYLYKCSFTFVTFVNCL